MAYFSKTLTSSFRNSLQLRSGFLSSLPKHWVPSSFSSSSPLSPFCSSAAAATISEQAPPAKEKESGSRLSKWLLFIPGAISFGLGTWQIFRRQDKIKTLEYRQRRLAMEPMKFNNISPSSEQLDALEFRRVASKGVFDDKRSIYVGPRSRSISGITENGYYVITPLMPIPQNPESAKATLKLCWVILYTISVVILHRAFIETMDIVQSPILVNRGWVPRSWKDESLEVSQDDEEQSDIAVASAQGSEKSSWWRFWSKKPKTIEERTPSITPVEVIGVVRGSENPSIFVPENDPSSFQWFYVDVHAIARACGLPENTIYVEDINKNFNSGCPYPVPKDVNDLIRSSVMPQDHLNYTLTWPQDLEGTADEALPYGQERIKTEKFLTREETMREEIFSDHAYSCSMNFLISQGAIFSVSIS
ncbi:unnamed protein product [Dovyalis caffra]|uniref:SURF1-like protein n=1 Tax=Dovyalis caffra TaxID=77055 RepID=A0AAV1SEV9_9ROSI|nr:unnamed protein product [Dovyalis caffra]